MTNKLQFQNMPLHTATVSFKFGSGLAMALVTKLIHGCYDLPGKNYQTSQNEIS